MSDFGGLMHATIGGTSLVLRGAFKINPVGVKSENKVNWNGTGGRVFTPTGYSAELTLEDTLPADVTWESLMKAEPATIALVEDQIGVVHTYSQATLVGEPVVNREDGEVSGLKIWAPSYQKT